MMTAQRPPEMVSTHWRSGEYRTGPGTSDATQRGGRLIARYRAVAGSPLAVMRSTGQQLPYELGEGLLDRAAVHLVGQLVVRRRLGVDDDHARAGVGGHLGQARNGLHRERRADRHEHLARGRGLDG